MDDSLREQVRIDNLKQEYNMNKDIRIREYEREKKRKDKEDKKIRENFYRDWDYNKQRVEEEKEKKYYLKEKTKYERQFNWEVINKMNHDKLKKIDKEKQKKIINEQIEITKKNGERVKKLIQRKNEFDMNNQQKNEERKEKLIAINNLKDEILLNKKKKFFNRQEHIKNFVDEQKRLRSAIIENRREKREEKIGINKFLRKRNDIRNEERRVHLLERFEDNENKVNLRNEIKDQQNQKQRFENFVRQDNAWTKSVRKNNQMIYENLLLRREMEERDENLRERFKEKELSAKQRWENDMRLHEQRQEMIKSAADVLSLQKKYDKNQVYQKIFSPEDLYKIEYKSNPAS